MIHLIQIITDGNTQNLVTAHHSEYVWPQNDIWGSGFGSFYVDVHPHSLGSINGDVICFGLPLKCVGAVLKLIKIRIVGVDVNYNVGVVDILTIEGIVDK